MKPSLIVSFVAVSAWAGASWADSGASTPATATLTWNRVALEAVERAKPTQHQAARLLALVSIAQHAALAEAGNREAAHDAIAGASMRVIADLLPSQAAFAEERHRQLRPQAGDEGLHAAERALAHAHGDGFAQSGSAGAPQAAYAWRSLANPPAPPAYAAIGAMRTFFIASGSAFRPGPPPELGSALFLDDLAEVRRHTQAPTEESARIAKFYDMTSGTLAAGFWNEQAADLIRREAVSERQAARILATVNAAMMDAFVACHDAKYTYWVPRPSQADPAIKPLIKVPNHPSYPSNHSCISTTAALVLAHFFPQDRGRLEGMAKEAGMARIYAGLHYRFDVDAGEEIGRKVSTVAVARHAEMLSRWTRTVVSAF
jgi:hypothetical protein